MEKYEKLFSFVMEKYTTEGPLSNSNSRLKEEGRNFSFIRFEKIY